MENYKKLLEKAQKAYKNCVTGAEKRRLESIFPELKESEDEDKIMKELIYNIIVSNDNTPSSKEIFSIYGKTKEDALSWLEKQGEQNPVWSEENSCYYDDICEILINLINSPKSKINKDAIQKDLDWLMSIVKSQLKPAWSEEDKEQLDRAIYMMEQLDMTKSWDDVYNWIKSLKDRVQPKQ